MAAEGSCTQPTLLSFTLFAWGAEGGELAGPEICNSPLSFRNQDSGADHQRQACNHSNLRTNEMLFWAREDFAQMSLEALVIVATAVEAHGLSFEKRLPQHSKTSRVKREICTAWNIGFLNINAISTLGNVTFIAYRFSFIGLPV